MGKLQRNVFICAFVLVVATAVLLALGGCATTKTTTTTTLKDGSTVTEIEQPSDFFESGNLRMYYESDSKRVDSHERNVSKKIDAVSGILAQPASNPEARAWQQAAGMMAVANIKDSAPVIGQMPKTMADVLGGNLGLLYQVGKDVFGLGGGSGNGDSSASGQGMAVNMTESDHNTMIFTTKPTLSGSNYYPSAVPTSTITTNINTGEEAMQGSGTFDRDQSTTKTGDSALAP